ncbi:MAG TPA: hypothetical protein PKU83_04715 [Chryseolinea sp.]|nr:hypothetical protein [Chryseolinea sp.]
MVREITSLPDNNAVKFYLLTNQSIYVGTETMDNFENNSSTWLKLFEEGNNVLTELQDKREVTAACNNGYKHLL